MCLTYFPAVFGDEATGERRKDERPDTGATDSDAICQRPALVEVKADCYDRWKIE